jgi:hypothetical protein
MLCNKFEAQCQAWLDARDTAALDAERPLELHAETCDDCRPIFLKYKRLRRAIEAGSVPAAVPEGLADRVLHQFESTPTPAWGAWRSGVSVAWKWAVAAAVLLGLGIGVRTVMGPREVGRRPIQVVKQAPVEPPTARPLSMALADATAATLDLARETSAPAARIGKDVIANASFPQSGDLALPVNVTPAVDVLQSVGDGVNRGVRPLSGTARRAFGFLIGPALGPKPAPSRREREA